MSTDSSLQKRYCNLNEHQYQAVIHQTGPLLIIAGAGSGKTRVITHRILFLLEELNVTDQQIIALTFTNKAASEMKERVRAQYFGKNLPFIGTFHAYCFSLLKQQYHGQPFSIMDAHDQEKLLKKISQKYGLEKKFTVKQLIYLISQVKSQIHGSLERASFFVKNPILFDLYQEYEYEKSLSHCFDFDDILVKALELFKNDLFKKKFQSIIRHILVDEYQDTNEVQHALLKEMTLEKENLMVDSICAVGDQDQSIYSWRGATPENMDRFSSDFQNTTIIKIQQNYRSIQPILNLANNLIENNINRHQKKLWSEKKAAHSIILLCCGSEYQEAEVIAITLKQLQSKKPDESIGILYRTHTQSRSIEEALVKANIPYTIIGGVEFYERAEIKDILAYLKLLVNPYDRISFLRIINTPSRGIGVKYQEQIFATWIEQPLLNCFELIEYIVKNSSISDSKKLLLKNFCTIFDGLSATSDVDETVRTIVERTNFFTYLKESYDEQEANDRIDNIKEFLSAIIHFKNEGIRALNEFLDEIALMQERLSNKKKSHHLFLMTLHSAKGLEFDSVILVGLEEQIIPSHRSTQTVEALEEERRLLYVGITRARNRLLLLYTKSRFFYGSLQKQLPSRFINELNSIDNDHYDVTYWQRITLSESIYRWICDQPFAMQDKISTKNNFFSTAAKLISKPIENNRINLQNKDTILKESFKLNESVFHTTYGRGIVCSIEKASEHTFVLVRFSCGIKKIMNSYLKKVM
jgi:DNA helicase-2/ATP-dependent DNA helicase PcrA